MGIDFLDQAHRKNLVEEINSEENLSRKREMQKRFDVYRDRQDRYILEKLEDEFSSKTVREMRKVLSINLSKRIVDEMASIYSQEPEREFSGASQRELEQIDALYSFGMANPNLRLANKYYKLFGQCALMVVPMNGTLMIRPLGPHMYDAVPDDRNPEKAKAIIMNVWSFDDYKTTKSLAQDNYLPSYRFNDRANQVIADDNDRMSKQGKYIVWTDEFHFAMDEKGQIISEQGIMPNPIGVMPFIDIATEKDFQYFVRRGSSLTDFAIDFSLQLSDLANISRLQGYSQAIVYAEKKPQNMVIGPNHVLFMELDSTRPEIKPSFEFASPSPDLAGSLEILETQLRLFLSSEGIEPDTVSGKGESKSFSSGVERLLAMLDKFEASRADFDLFRGVEEDLFDLMRLWSNELQGADENGLIPELNQAMLSDSIKLSTKFQEPGVVRTQQEKEDAVIKLLNEGLMTKREAIMEIRGVDKKRADEILDELDEESKINTPPQLLAFNQGEVEQDGEAAEGDNQDNEDAEAQG